MNPAFTRKIRHQIRKMRDSGFTVKESKTLPGKITIGMCLITDEKLKDHGYVSFYKECLMLYLTHGKELEEIKHKFKEAEKDFYPHLADHWDEYHDTGDIYKKDKNGEWLISDDEITRRHKILDGIAIRYFKK